jgi:4-amino-4-deoxy-L-arabinose transferase-like glycosyltransferase
VKPERWTLALVGVAVLVAVVLRFYALDTLSFYYDELYATRIYGLGVRNLAGVVARTAFYDQHPPLYYLVALVWTHVTGLSEAAVRALSALSGVALVPAVWLLARELSERRTAAFAALLVALHPLLVYYSREARMYALLALFATLASWLFARLCRGDRARTTLVAWVVASLATALTHYFGAVHLAGCFLLLMLRRHHVASLAAWVAPFALLGAVFVPFAFFARYQAAHFDSSYLGFGARAYLDVFVWLGGAHTRLPAAPLMALPLVGLAALGLRASWREPSSQGGAFASPPPPRSFERAGWVLASFGALAVAAVVFVLRNRLANAITDVEVARGEAEGVAITQGQTAVVATFFGALATGGASLLMAARDRIEARIARWRSPPTATTEQLDPARSLAWVALVALLLPFVLTLAAGLAGKALVLVRNFVLAAPFVALLAARGLSALSPRPRAAATALVVAMSLVVAARIGALPPRTPDGERLHAWLLHTYVDYRAVASWVRDDAAVPIVCAQHYATDAMIHYRGAHPVVRVRINDGGALEVGQVRADDGAEPGFRENEALHPELVPKFYWVDVPLAHDHGLARRLVDAAQVQHQCTRVGAAAGGATVYVCVMQEAVAWVDVTRTALRRRP